MTIGMRAESGGPPGTVYGGYAREEEHVISVQFLGSQQDVSTSRKKKRKQVEDAPART